MADTAAHLVDHVLPHVPYRQWVMSYPRRVRFLLACNPELLSRVLTITLRKIFAFQRRRARRRDCSDPRTGAVAFAQRFGSMLNLNVHVHAVVPDGVFVEASDGRITFHALPPPTDADVERLVGQIARAVEREVAKHQSDTTDAESPSILSQTRAHATRTPPNPFTDAQRRSRRSAFLVGYSLHADRIVEQDERDKLERLCRYGARSPIALSRLGLDDQGNVIMRLKRPLSTGQRVLTFSPSEFLRRLAALVPPRHKNLTRYYGVFAPNHSWRSRIVPGWEQTPTAGDAVGAADGAPPAARPRLSWAELLRRVFAIDVLTCDACGGSMKIIAILPESPATDAILAHLDLPTAPPAPRAQAPPQSDPPACDDGFHAP